MKPVLIVLAILIGGTHLSAQWEKIFEVTNEYGTMDILSVFADEELGIFAGVQLEGLYHSTDKGNSWEYKGFKGHDIKSITKDYFGRILVLTNRIFYSNDTGKTWQQTSVMNPNNGQIESIKKVKSNSNSGYIYASAEYERLYLTTDGGTVWNLIATFDLGCWCGSRIESIEPINEKGILVGAYVYCSDYGGSCYVHKLHKSTNGFVWYEVLNADIELLHSVMDSIILATDDSKLYRSTDYGESWSNQIFADINVMKSNVVEQIYIGSEDGVSYSIDLGETWHSLDNTGLLNNYIYDIAFTSGKIIYVGTRDGMYKRPGILTNISSNENIVANDFILYQNYPNPFNPKTMIKFYLAEESRVNISIYNLVGEKIKVLFNGQKDKGLHSITWNADNYSSGVYICRVNTVSSIGSNSKQLKLIYLK